MALRNRKTVIYLKGGTHFATSYYRFYQYFQNMEGRFVYHRMIPDRLYDVVMPISNKRLINKVLIYGFIWFRLHAQLVFDLFWHPNYVIISRCLINKHIPYSIKTLLLFVRHRGAKIIWDFDDNLIAGGEISRCGFDFLSTISSAILVGSPYLKDLINQKWHEKVIFVPTTDGDIWHLVNREVEEKRIEQLKDCVRLVWVGTFSSLNYVRGIFEQLESCANKLGSRQLILTIVSDERINYSPVQFKLIQIPWTREIAIQEMLNAHIGIMPLDDNIFTRGKCGFKLIQYLSAALPVIGSDVGMNADIISRDVGVPIDDHTGWDDAILLLSKSPETWINYSRCSFRKWNRDYNTEFNMKVWERLLS